MLRVDESGREWCSTMAHGQEFVEKFAEKHQTAELRMLDLLLQEAAQARDDDRYWISQFAVIISVALGLVLALGTLFYNTCSEGYSCQPATKLIPVPIWIYIGAPLLPIVLIAYAVLTATTSTLRSYYLRTIERRIHAITNQLDDNFPVPSWSHIQLDVNGQSHSRGFAR